jgi:polar amino acid transport system permease protein
MPPPLDLLPSLLGGLWITLGLTAGGAGVAFAAAWLSGLGRLSKVLPIRWLSIAYIETFRGTSALVQLYWFYFALPLIGVSLSAMTTGILVLGLNIGSYGGEVVRGAIQAVPKGQHEASTALNMSPLQSLWLVTVPQAAIAMLPPAGNLLIELLKSTALVSLITLSDMTFRGQLLRAETLRTTEIFGLLLVMYFAIALVLTYFVRMLERRLTRGRQLEVSH